jgi:eukaryotic-like serine/threonine-protein kinase
VSARVTPEEAARREKAPSVDPQAHDAYLLGRYHVARLTNDSINRAIDYFQRAIRIDPRFALAHAGLSNAYRQADIWTGIGVGKHASEVRLSALKAIELDPDLAEAHAALADVYFQYDWDWPRTEASYRKAFELNPNFAEGYAIYPYYLVAMGRFDEAIASARRATTLDPLSPSHHANLGRTLYRARRYDEAIASYLRALELDADYRPALTRLAEAYTQTGKFDAALETIDRLERVDDRRPWRARGRVYAAMGRTADALAVVERMSREGAVGDRWFAQATIYTQLGRRDDALTALERGVQAHFRGDQDTVLPFVFADPAVDPLRDDPRFNAMLDRAKLPRYTIPQTR